MYVYINKNIPIFVNNKWQYEEVYTLHNILDYFSQKILTILIPEGHQHKQTSTL